MVWTIPGTVLERPRQEAEQIEDMFCTMFLAGGMVLSQISELAGIEPYAVQNWVKRGFLTPPEHKRYSLQQLCRVLNINCLKNILPMEQIVGLLRYVNGQLDDASDDLIDDAQLYFMFVRLAARAKDLYQENEREALLEKALANYQEPVPGAKKRVKRVLQIMLTAWLAARMRQEAEKMLLICREETENE